MKKSQKKVVYTGEKIKNYQTKPKTHYTEKYRSPKWKFKKSARSFLDIKLKNRKRRRRRTGRRSSTAYMFFFIDVPTLKLQGAAKIKEKVKLVDLHYTATMYCAVALCCAVVYCTIQYWEMYSSVWYSTVQYWEVYNTVYNTVNEIRESRTITQLVKMTEREIEDKLEGGGGGGGEEGKVLVGGGPGLGSEKQKLRRGNMNAMESLEECSAVQCSAVQYSTVQYSESGLYSTVQ